MDPIAYQIVNRDQGIERVCHCFGSYLVSSQTLFYSFSCYPGTMTSEKYSFVKFPERILYPELLDCYGKLAISVSGGFYAGSEDMELWVLQNTERHEWSKLVYILPPMWKDVVGPHDYLEVVGGAGPNEFVMSPRYSSDHFHVFYCNFEKETVTRVVIQKEWERLEVEGDIMFTHI
ncbi:hypothetical protein F2Q69_00017910 [Brassica cretica]|uniref:F-box associated beta-propeller type 3 domain-containing protein n=1 Tax=Brassica cretica TaxID=69181 RepID=A0A8S9R1X0_BRACR|nr:hypothetical protein F2Q69_00017910 [Brassica cretica]